MIMDNKLVFSDAQAITASAASDYYLNFVETAPNLGKGTPLYIRFVIEETFVTGDSLVIALQHGATTTPATEILALTAILTANLTKGAYIPEIKVPDEHLQYMRLYYTVSGSNFTLGKITAFISLDR